MVFLKGRSDKSSVWSTRSTKNDWNKTVFRHFN